jgi:hypothetical protein
MNEESRPSRRLSDNWNAACEPSGRLGDRLAWSRAVRGFTDEELVDCVRAQIAVERAVNTYRSSAAPPVRFDVPG